MRIHDWGAMCFALFFQWFSPRTSGCVVHCDNQFHRWARVAVWLLEQKNLWWETPNLFEWTRKNIGFLMREDKLQPLQINEIDYHSKLLNRWCERLKTIEKTEKNTSSCKRMYFELPLKSFFYIFECRMGLSSTEPAESNTIKIKLLWEKLA